MVLVAKMDRNKPILILFLIAILVYSSCREPSEQIKPNIILINIDDMGWRDLGYMGSEYYETPNIDALAALGMVFTNGYAASANCAPSRASLMTGMWAPRHGIYTVNSSERGASKHRKLVPTKNTPLLAEDHRIIPKILHQNGYATCHAGKWHLSENPLNYGFDLNIAGGPNGHPKSYYPPYKNVTIAGANDQYLTDLVMEKTIKFVDTVSSPFFLNYAPYAVHTPIHPVNNLLEKYNSKPSWNGQDNAEYATMVENVDRNIGLLVSKLKERNLFHSTLLIFTSDNGGLYGITKQTPLRAGKGSYYEGGIRTPFFFILKDKIRANSKNNIPITNIDLFPTILDYAGISVNALKLDGASLVPVLEEKVSKLDRPLFWHFPIYLQAYSTKNNENRDSLFRTRPGSVVRYKQWKLHYYFENDEIELYDLDSDIGEKYNLAHNRPEMAEEMVNFLKEWWVATQAPIPTELNAEYDN